MEIQKRDFVIALLSLIIILQILIPDNKGLDLHLSGFMLSLLLVIGGIMLAYTISSLYILFNGLKHGLKSRIYLMTSLIAMPFVAVILALFLSMFSIKSLIIIPILVIAFFAGSFYYALKRKVWLAIIPIIMGVLLFAITLISIISIYG